MTRQVTRVFAIFAASLGAGLLCGGITPALPGLIHYSDLQLYIGWGAGLFVAGILTFVSSSRGNSNTP